MFSSRIKALPSQSAAAKNVQASGLWQPPSVRRFLPRTLFGRSVLILVMPAIIVQAVATWVFYDRFDDSVMHRLSSSVAGDIALVLETRSLIEGEGADDVIFAYANEATQLGYQVYPDKKLRWPEPPRSSTTIKDYLATALKERVSLPFQIDDRSLESEVIVSIEMPDGALVVSVPRNRLFTARTYQILLWMFGTGVVTCGIGTLFLRNQVRSILRLAVAADAFGKGRDMPDFRPSGAVEVRQAAAAFLVMRQRIQRQITQRTEMLAGVSHDLRTPLTRMKLELELLGDGEDTDGLKADVEEMEQMIAGYLSFVRGEGNEEPVVIDLVDFAGDTVETAKRGGASISLMAPAELYFPIRREAMRRCLMNLISNAVRYGGSQVWVTVEEGVQSVSIVIDDSGPGISDTDREDVFRPFFRLERSRNMKTGGVGLGLTIARDIARGHGGDLTLGDAPQGGLRARINLPR